MECLRIREGTPREKAKIITQLRQKYKLDKRLAAAELSYATYYYHFKRFSSKGKYSKTKALIFDLLRK